MEKPLIDYLRLSVTDKCNLRCGYCKPLDDQDLMRHEDILRYEELAKLVEIFASCGIKKIRITGGEPLVKRNIAHLVRMIRTIDGIEDISLTTNGTLLLEHLSNLKAAGLDRLNISLNTLQKEKYVCITGSDKLSHVINGIYQAISEGFSSIKINVVKLKGINDDEILDFVQFAIEHNVIVRFIESFHTNRCNQYFKMYFVPESYVKITIKDRYGALKPYYDVIGSGPAEYFKVGDTNTVVGFISNNSNKFCHKCSRLRLTCDGKLMPCLFSSHTIDLRAILRSDVYNIKDKILDCIYNKTHYKKDSSDSKDFYMCNIGG